MGKLCCNTVIDITILYSTIVYLFHDFILYGTNFWIYFFSSSNWKVCRVPTATLPGSGEGYSNDTCQPQCPVCRLQLSMSTFARLGYLLCPWHLVIMVWWPDWGIVLVTINWAQYVGDFVINAFLNKGSECIGCHHQTLRIICCRPCPFIYVWLCQRVSTTKMSFVSISVGHQYQHFEPCLTECDRRLIFVSPDFWYWASWLREFFYMEYHKVIGISVFHLSGKHNTVHSIYLCVLSK